MRWRGGGVWMHQLLLITAVEPENSLPPSKAPHPLHHPTISTSRFPPPVPTKVLPGGCSCCSAHHWMSHYITTPHSPAISATKGGVEVEVGEQGRRRSGRRAGVGVPLPPPNLVAPPPTVDAGVAVEVRHNRPSRKGEEEEG